MSKYHEVTNISFHGDNMTLTVDGQEHTVDLKQHSTRLIGVVQAVKEDCQVSPSGYGIHWPQVDEDLAIDSLIGKTPAYETPKPAAGAK